jgi:hypothetical protein
MVLWLPFGVCGSRLVESSSSSIDAGRPRRASPYRAERTAAHVDIVSSPLGTVCRIARATAHDYGTPEEDD